MEACIIVSVLSLKQVGKLLPLNRNWCRVYRHEHKVTFCSTWLEWVHKISLGKVLYTLHSRNIIQAPDKHMQLSHEPVPLWWVVAAVTVLSLLSSVSASCCNGLLPHRCYATTVLAIAFSWEWQPWADST